MKKQLKCQTCGKEFTSTIKRDNGYTAKFCSKACGSKPKVKKICETCNKEYEVIPYRADKSKWCSRKCTNNKGKNNPNWRGGKTDGNVYFTEEWYTARRKALQRDNYTCQNCGATKDEAKLHVNHIIPYRLIQSHIIANLVTLCNVCHPKMDWKVANLLNVHPMRKRFLELIVQMWETNIRKSENYAKEKDPLSNLRKCEEFGVPAHIGAMVRMSDKWSRLEQLMGGKEDMVGESIKDTLIDLAVYCLLEVILIENHEEQSE